MAQNNYLPYSQLPSDDVGSSVLSKSSVDRIKAIQSKPKLPMPKSDEQGFGADMVDKFQEGFYNTTGSTMTGLRGLFTDTQEPWNIETSQYDAAKRQKDTLSSAQKEADAKLGFGDGKELSVRNVLGLMSNAAGSIGPSIAGGGVPGALLKGGAKLAGAGVSAQKVAQVAGYGAGGATQIGGATKNQVEQELGRYSQEQLEAIDGYKSYLDTLSPEEAKKQFTYDQSQEALGKAGVLGAVSMGALGPLMEKIILGGLGKGAVKNILAGAGVEGAQEAIEEGGQTRIANPLTGKPDWEGVAESAGLGAIGGMGAGGMAGAGGAAINAFSEETKRKPGDVPMSDDQGNQIGWRDQITGETYTPIQMDNTGLPKSQLSPEGKQPGLPQPKDMGHAPVQTPAATIGGDGFEQQVIPVQRTPDQATGVLDKALLSAGVDVQQPQNNTPLPEAAGTQNIEQPVKKTGREPLKERQQNTQEVQHEQAQNETKAAQKNEAANPEAIPEGAESAEQVAPGNKVSFKTTKGNDIAGEVVEIVNNKVAKIKLDHNGKTIRKQVKLLTPKKDPVKEAIEEAYGAMARSAVSVIDFNQKLQPEKTDPNSSTGQANADVATTTEAGSALPEKASVTAEQKEKARSQVEPISKKTDTNKRHSYISGRFGKTNIDWGKTESPYNTVHLKNGEVHHDQDGNLNFVRGDGNAGNESQVTRKPETTTGSSAEVQPDANQTDQKTRSEGKKEIEAAADESALSPNNNLPEPSQAQKEAGNYKKGHTKVQGMDVSIENPKGSERKGTDTNGKEWSTKMNDHYGYFKGTVGYDKDHLDVFMGPGADKATSAYVVDQINPDSGKFDEHKVMLGYPSKEDAKKAYQKNYDKNWKGLSNITEMPIDEFKQWAYSDEPKKGSLNPKRTRKSKIEKDNADIVKQYEAKGYSLKHEDGDNWTLDRKGLGKTEKLNTNNINQIDRAIELYDNLKKKADPNYETRQDKLLAEKSKTEEAERKAKKQIEENERKLPERDGTFETSLERIKKGKKTLSSVQQEFELNGDRKFIYDAIKEKSDIQDAYFFSKKLDSQYESDWQDAFERAESILSPNQKTKPESKPEKQATVQETTTPDKKDVKAEKEPQAKERPEEKNTFQDAGEKIGGARKDIWSGFKDKVETDYSDDEILSLPLSKLIPKPNYETLLNDGADKTSIAIIRAMYEAIPRKTNRNRGRYKKAVKDFQATSKQLLANPPISKELLNGNKFDGFQDIRNKAELYLELGLDNDLKDIELNENFYASIYEKGKPTENNVTKWVAKDKSIKNYLGGEIIKADNREDALTALKAHLIKKQDKAKKQGNVKFDVYKYRGLAGRKGWIAGKKMRAGVYMDLKSGFESANEARSYIDNNQELLESQLKEKKKIPNVRRDANDPRVGEDYRNGENIKTSDEFKDSFGFRGVEFGNWVEQSKRQQDVNEAYDALMDLANILNIPPEAVSLNGELGLAFGARGKGGADPAKAHYEPGSIVINLTKKNGAGSLGHEWWHGLDNYFARTRGDRLSYLTDKPRQKQTYQGKDESIRPEVIEAFKNIVQTISNSDLPSRSRKLDDKRSKAYWETIVEMTARSFESYLIDKMNAAGASNDYLANIMLEEAWNVMEEGSYPYPTAKEQKQFSEAFDKLFSTLKTRKTDQGTALFSRGVGADVGATLGHDVVVPIVKSLMRGFPGLNYQVYPSEPDLPSDIQEQAKQDGATGNVKAVYWRNKVYVVGNKFHDQSEVEEAVLHEVTGHYGLRVLLGKDKQAADILKRLYFNLRTPGVQRLAKASGVDLTDYIETAKGMNQDQRAIYLADELLAHLQGAKVYESLPQKIKRLLSELWGSIRHWLKKKGFNNVSEYSDTDIAYLTKRMAQAAKDGEMAKNDDRAAFIRATPGNNPDDIVYVNGNDVFSEIDQRIASEAKEQSGVDIKPAKIQLHVGKHVDGDRGNHGIKHIEAKHGDEIEKTGLSIEEFVYRALNNFNQMWVTGNRLALAKAGKKKTVSIIELMNMGDGYYSVVTAYPVDSQYKKFGKLAWKGRAHGRTNGEFSTESQAQHLYNDEAPFTGKNASSPNTLRDESTSANNIDQNGENINEPNDVNEKAKFSRKSQKNNQSSVITDTDNNAILKELEELSNAIERGEANYSQASIVRKVSQTFFRDTAKDQKGRVEQNFGSWFKDSKAVEADGLPAIFYYRGHRPGKQVFKGSELGGKTKDPLSGMGFFSSKQPEPTFGEHEVQMFARAENPYFIASKEALADELKSNGYENTFEGHTKFKDEILKPMGFDSVYLEHNGWLAVFDPNQYKSTDNSGDFSEIDDRIMFSKQTKSSGPTDPDKEKMSSFDAPLKPSYLETIQHYLQDKFGALKKIQNTIGVTNEDADVYLNETLFHGKVKKRMDDFESEYVEPLMEAIHNSGKSMDEVGRYLHARHAQEANRVLKERNPDRQDNTALSGMTDAEASKILSETKGMKSIVSIVDGINKSRLQTLEDEGLITPEEAQAWKNTYSKYVPLHRTEIEENTLPARGAGFNIKGKESKLRTGSTREVDHVNLIANLVAGHEASIVRAEKNKVGQSLYNLVKDNPNPDFWEIDTEKQTGKLGKDGKMQWVADNRETDSDLMVKIDGKPHRISFNTNNEYAKRIVSSLKNLTAREQNTMVNGLTMVNRWLAAINTSFSPEFVISNFFRDIQTAGYNMSDTEADGLQKKVLKDIAKSYKGIRHALYKKDGDNEWAKYFDEFEKDGGRTGWLDHYQDIDSRRKALQKELEKFDSNKKVRHFWRKLGNFIENENSAVENAVRLATYVHAKKAGISPKKAAQIAKELTVNFNKGGEYKAAMNAAYLFYNASIQGTIRMALALKNKKVQKFVGATVVAAIMLDMINRSIGGDDEDDESFYDKIPSHVKDRNMIFMIPDSGGDYAKIPLPWGYNVFHIIGQEIGSGVDSAMGRNPEWKALNSAGRIAGSTLEAFNPVNDGSLMQTISPTITDPFVKHYTNTDWHGGNLKPEQSPYGRPKPEYQMTYSSTHEAFKSVAKFMNDISGGDEVEGGYLNISPETIDMIWSTATGSVGRVISDTIDLPMKVINNEDIEGGKIPIARKLFGTQSEYQRVDQYYDRAQEILTVADKLKHYRGDRQELIRVRSEAGNRLKLITYTKATEKRLKNLRKQKRLAQKRGDKTRVDLVKKQINGIQMRYNTRYRQVMYQ